MTCRLCAEPVVVTCFWCHGGLCAAHAEANCEECPNCRLGWLEEIDQTAALRYVTERTAATGGPSGDGSSSLLSWALIVAGRVGCSDEEIRAAAARGRVLRERRRLRVLAGTVR